MTKKLCTLEDVDPGFAGSLEDASTEFELGAQESREDSPKAQQREPVQAAAPQNIPDFSMLGARRRKDSCATELYQAERKPSNELFPQAGKGELEQVVEAEEDVEMRSEYGRLSVLSGRSVGERASIIDKQIGQGDFLD